MEARQSALAGSNAHWRACQRDPARASMSQHTQSCTSQLQMQNLNQAVLVADQRKSLWLKQQQKRKAIDFLIEKQEKAKQQVAQKQEQAMLDELSIQKFIRRQS